MASVEYRLLKGTATQPGSCQAYSLDQDATGNARHLARVGNPLIKAGATAKYGRGYAFQGAADYFTQGHPAFQIAGDLAAFVAFDLVGSSGGNGVDPGTGGGQIYTKYEDASENGYDLTPADVIGTRAAGAAKWGAGLDFNGAAGNRARADLNLGAWNLPNDFSAFAAFQYDNLAAGDNCILTGLVDDALGKRAPFEVGVTDAGEVYYTHDDGTAAGGGAASLSLVADSGPNGHPGVLHGATTVPSQVASPWVGFGNALQFNGADHYVDCGAPGTRTTTGLFTLEARFKADSVASGIIAGRGRGAGFNTAQAVIYLAGGKIGVSAVRASDGLQVDLSGATNIIAGTTHVIAATCDGVTLSIYLDGVRDGFVAIPGGAIAAADDIPFTIGVFSSLAGLAQYYQGTIDEVRYSNSSRYAGANYAVAGVPFASDASTLVLYHLDAVTSGQATPDWSTKNRHAFATGSPTLVASPFGAEFDYATSYPGGALHLAQTFPASGNLTAECTINYVGILNLGDIGLGKTPGATINAGDQFTLGVSSVGGSTGKPYFSIINGAGALVQLFGPAALVGGIRRLAGTYDGATLSLYVDGVRVASTPTSRSAVLVTTDQFYVFACGGAGQQSATVAEVRISNSSRYAGANYAVATGPFVNDINTIGLWHLNAAATSLLRVSDSSGNNRHGTMVGILKSAYQPSVAGFGDRLAVPERAATIVANFNTSGQITVEGRVRKNGGLTPGAGDNIVAYKASAVGVFAGDDFQLFYTTSGANSGKLRGYLVNGGGALIDLVAAAASANGEHVCALTYDGVTARLFEDGAVVASLVTSRSAVQTANPTYIAANGNPLFCSVDEVRISNVDRYLGIPYIPAAAPFASDANTLTLYHGSGGTSLGGFRALSAGLALTNAQHRLTVRRTISDRHIVVKVDGVERINTNWVAAQDPRGQNLAQLTIGERTHPTVPALWDGGIYEVRVWGQAVAQATLDLIANPADIVYASQPEGNEVGLYYLEDQGATQPALGPPKGGWLIGSSAANGDGAGNERRQYEVRINAAQKIEYSHRYSNAAEYRVAGVTVLPVGAHRVTVRRVLGTRSIVVKVDGVTEINAVWPGGQDPLASALTNLSVGARGDGDAPFEGGIYEVRIWPTALAQATLDVIANPADATYTESTEGTEAGAWFFSCVPTMTFLEPPRVILDGFAQKTFERFARVAEARVDDEDGTAAEDFPEFTPVKIEFKRSNDAAWARLFGGFSSKAERNRDDAVIEILSHDAWLKDREIFLRANARPLRDVLQDVVLGYTPLLWDDTQITVATNSLVTRSWNGEKIEEVIRELASIDADAEWGADDDGRFFFRPRGLVAAPQDYAPGDYYVAPFVDDNKRRVIRAVVYYGNNVKLDPLQDGTKNRLALRLEATQGDDPIRAEVSAATKYGGGFTFPGITSPNTHLIADGDALALQRDLSLTAAIRAGGFTQTLGIPMAACAGLLNNDVSGNGRNFTAAGAPGIVVAADKWGSGYDLNGAQGFTHASNVWKNLGDLSLFIVVTPDVLAGLPLLATGDGAPALGNVECYTLLANADGSITYRHSTGPLGANFSASTAAGVLVAGTKAAITVRRDAGTAGVVIKVNGTTVLNAAYGAAVPENRGTVFTAHVGEDVDAASRANFKVWEYRIWHNLVAQATLDMIASPTEREYGARLEGSEMAAWFMCGDTPLPAPTTQHLLDARQGVNDAFLEVVRKGDGAVAVSWTGQNGATYTATSATFPMLADAEYRLTVLRDTSSGIIRVKVGGVLVIDATFTGLQAPKAFNPANTCFLQLGGKRTVGANASWKGGIFEVRVWDQLISQVILDQIADPANPLYSGEMQGAELACYFLEGINLSGAVAVTDQVALSAARSRIGLPGDPIVTVTRTFPQIDTPVVAASKARQLIGQRAEIRRGTIKTWEAFTHEPGQVTHVTVPESSVDADYRIARIKYGFGSDTTEITVAENQEGVVDALVDLSGEVTRIESRAANRDAAIRELNL